MTKPKQLLPLSLYVYALVDPRTGQPFYIGKGCRGRMYHHEAEAKRGKKGKKHDRIREILACEMTVSYHVLGEYDSDQEAFAAEKDFIAAADGLLNMNGGGGGSCLGGAYGIMRRRAQRSLAKLRPFSSWNRNIPLRTRTALDKLFGSARKFYEDSLQVLQAEAISPSPNVIYADADGKITFGWEL